MSLNPGKRFLFLVSLALWIFPFWEIPQLDFIGFSYANENNEINDTKKSERIGLDDFPTEIQREIFSFLNSRDLAAVKVTHHFKKLSSDLEEGVEARILELLGLGDFLSFSKSGFQMGSPKSEIGRFPDEAQHWVDLSPFEITETPISQEKFAQVMGFNPSLFQGPDHCPDQFKILEVNGNLVPVCPNRPVERVSWVEANQFINHFNQKYRYLDYDFSLPTEAQLEFLCRSIPTAPSRVAEWAKDWYQPKYLSHEVKNPFGPARGKNRVVRMGCSQIRPAEPHRCALRHSFPPEGKDVISFRVVRTRIKYSGQ